MGQPVEELADIYREENHPRAAHHLHTGQHYVFTVSECIAVHCHWLS